MVNKRGWLRIVEASIAVLLIIGAILIVSKSKAGQDNEELNEDIISALDNIAENFSVRAYILAYNTEELENSSGNIQLINKINESLYSQFGGAKPKILFKICSINVPCSIKTNNEAFSYQRIISTNSESLIFSPKKIIIVAS